MSAFGGIKCKKQKIFIRQFKFKFFSLPVHFYFELIMATLFNRRNGLTDAKRLEILDALKTKKQSEVATEFGVHKSVISRIKKNEDEIQDKALANGNLNRKRQRESPNEDVADALIAWFHQMRVENAVINGPLMLEKARQLAIMLGHEDFEPSPGWLDRLKIKHNIKFVKVSGERAAADHTGAENWIENVLPAVIDGYNSDHIFNADETGLFYKAALSSTLAVAGSHPTGGKTPKDRITVLFLCNLTGSEKRRM